MKNKVLTALLSLLIAFGIWLYVITVVSPGYEDTFYNIPVTFRGENLLQERGLMLIADKAPTVTLKLSGNRSDLSKLSSANITVTADLSNISSAGKQTVRYDVSYPGDVPQTAITILSQTPGQVTVEVEEQANKSVPVEVVYSGSVPDGFMADTANPILDYSEVTVIGPSPVVEQITKARIDVDLENKTTSISESFRYTLCNAAGEPVDAEQVVTNVGEINMILTIQRVKEIKLVLNVIPGGGATEATSEITIEPETIMVSGSETVLAGLDQIELGKINLAEITQAKTLTFTINLPSGVTSLSGVAEATVTVQFPDLATKTLYVTNIMSVNIPEGMEADVLTRAVEIKVRGPKNIINAIKESDIVVTVDFTDAKAGTSTMPVSITIGAEYSSVGAVGSYSVAATLREETEPPEA